MLCVQPLNDDTLLMVTGGKNNDDKRKKIIYGIALYVLFSLVSTSILLILLRLYSIKNFKSKKEHNKFYHTSKPIIKPNYTIGEKLPSGFCIELVENDYNDVD